MNITALLQRVQHRCGMHGKDLPADEALALAAEVVTLRALVIRAGAYFHSHESMTTTEKLSISADVRAAAAEAKGGA